MSLILSSTLSFTYTEEPHVNLVWHWEDDFSPEEQRKVEKWLSSVTGAVEETLGVYPFDLHFFIHRRDGSREPVPWASTRRHSSQGVDFHVDPSYSLQSFLDDWTAPHEISHLSIPYLGREHAWFAEGYASYMQYQVMQTLGILSGERVREMYAQKIERVRPSYDRDQDFVSVAKDHQSRNRYPDMYWGGASFFMKIDQGLADEYGQTFPGFIKEYLLCCRLENEAFVELIESWDHLLGEPIFSELLHTYQSAPASEILK
ncbi:MAG: hypothetical protein MUO54_12055 [Anaerolineales bacterium]|nr:hypothetical protein [Anaerolineales bacterium]